MKKCAVPLIKIEEDVFEKIGEEQILKNARNGMDVFKVYLRWDKS